MSFPALYLACQAAERLPLPAGRKISLPELDGRTWAEMPA